MNILQGKCISILGDSISTYEGYSNEPLYNPTIGVNAVYYNGQIPVELTYWHRLIDCFGLELCVNNSWSGSYVCKMPANVGEDPQGEMSCCVKRAKQLTGASGQLPDIIIIYLGSNDFGRRNDLSAVKSRYDCLLSEVSLRYPDAQIFCAGVSDYDILFAPIKEEDFNRIIIDAVKKAGDRFHYVDMYNGGGNDLNCFINSIDGLHPNAKGMEILFSVFKAEFEKVFS